MERHHTVRRSAYTDFTGTHVNIVRASRTIGGRLDTSVEDLTNKTDKLKKQVEQDVDTNIKAVKNEVSRAQRDGERGVQL